MTSPGPHPRHVSTVLLLGLVIGCGGGERAASEEEREAALEATRVLGAMTLTLADEPAVSLRVETRLPAWWQDRSAIVVTATRGAATSELTSCELSRGGVETRLRCNGNVEIVRAGARYEVRVNDALAEATRGQYRYEARGVFAVQAGEPRRLDVEPSVGLHPFAIAERVDAALARVGAAERDWSEYGFAVRAGPETGAVDRCSASLYVDRYDPSRGVVEAPELERRLRASLPSRAPACPP